MARETDEDGRETLLAFMKENCPGFVSQAEHHLSRESSSELVRSDVRSSLLGSSQTKGLTEKGLDVSEDRNGSCTGLLVQNVYEL